MENEVKEDKVLKKANQAIMGKAASGKNLTLLTRKLMNALAYFAQSAGQIGMGPPAAIRDAVAKRLEQEREVPESFWWVPLSEVVSCTAYDSNDIKLLKKKCIELQSMQLITESDIFGSRSLFTAIYIVNSNGAVDKKGGQLWICWKYAPVAADAILNPPVGFTKLNLFYQAKLTSAASLALYEIGRSYVYPSNPGPRTKTEHWHYWFRLLSGVADDVTPPEFKYANRDVFLHAVDQVSKETDIDVEMVVDRKVGKAVADIHFRFKQKTNEVQRVVDGPLIDTGLEQELRNIGFSDAVIEDLFDKHSVPQLRRCLLDVKVRLANKNLEPVKSTPALFRSYLAHATNTAAAVPAPQVAAEPKIQAQPAPANGEAVPVVPAAAPQPPAAPIVPKEASAFKEIQGRFNALPPLERNDLLNSWMATVTTSLADDYLKNGLRSPFVAAKFFPWYAEKTIVAAVYAHRNLTI